MATDIADKELQALRKASWVVAFDDKHVDGTPEEGVNRKATIVIEHLIQASDVSHTMQHWHVYRKWNQRFFNECYKAYKEGRADTDPSLGWYKGACLFYSSRGALLSFPALLTQYVLCSVLFRRNWLL